MLILAALACQVFAPKLTTSEFEGYYVYSYETSLFVPCDDSNPAGFGEGYWLIGTTEFNDQYSSLSESNPVYVRFKGALSSAGVYIHNGSSYKQEITVTELLEMSADNKCPDN